MVQDGKKRHVISFENMSKELAEVFNVRYPKGFNDYLPDLVKYPRPDGTYFYAVTIEIPDAIYLIKIKVDVDDAEDIERWLEGEEEAGAEQMAGTDAGSNAESDALPDDNISQYGGDDDQGDTDTEA